MSDDKAPVIDLTLAKIVWGLETLVKALKGLMEENSLSEESLGVYDVSYDDDDQTRNTRNH